MEHAGFRDARRFRGWVRFAAFSIVYLLGACGDLTTGPQDQRIAAVGAASYACNVMVGDTYVMCPISGGGGGDECDPWTSLNWCGGGDCMMSTAEPEFEGISGCLPTTPPGGGGTQPTCPEWDPTCSTEPPPTESTDTCRTGNPVIDDVDVWRNFDKLWKLSITEGTERGGWIIAETGGGYRFEPFRAATYSPCGIDTNEAPPAGTVAILHTHPWPLFQINPCGDPNMGVPSDEDIHSLNIYGFSVGYILDGNGIATYNGSGAQSAVRTGRCGY